MKNKIILLTLFAIIIASCNPCKQVARHPECFPGDTIKINNETIRYEKIYITEDSLIYDTIPCIENEAVNVETVYKTIWRTRIDTIIKDKQVSKVNPLNEALKDSNDELTKKIERRKVFIWYSIGMTALLIIFIVIKVFFKKLRI